MKTIIFILCVILFASCTVTRVSVENGIQKTTVIKKGKVVSETISVPKKGAMWTRINTPAILLKKF